MPAGGKRPGAGRKPKATIEGEPLPPLPKNRTDYAKLIDALNGDPKPDESDEVKGWRRYWDQAGNAGLAVRKFLYSQKDGDPEHTVRYVQEKPMEVNVKVELSEVVRQVRERKREYERNRR